MFQGIWEAICVFFAALFGGKAKKNVPAKVHGLAPRIPHQLLRLAGVQDVVATGTQALGHREHQLLARIYGHGSLDSKNKNLVVLVLDLSSSIEGITKAYAQGYKKFVDSLRAWNPNLILIGFDRTMRLLYQGPIANAPAYTEEHFSPGTKVSLLGHGTGLYRAVLMCSLLATELSERTNVSVTWLTDGLDSSQEDQHPISLGIAASMTKVLQKLGISYRVIGMLNPSFRSSTISLDEVLRRLNPPPVRRASPEAQLQTLNPDRAFALAQAICQKRIDPGSMTEIDLG